MTGSGVASRAGTTADSQVPGTTEAEGIAYAVVEAAERAIELVADLDEDQLVGPLLPTVNPLIWEIGHLAWFQEKFVLRQAASEPPLLAYGDALYDSGAVPHDTRWRLVLPSLDDTVAYVREVAERVAQKVLDPRSTDVVRHFALYSVFHYDWHAEAVTYTRQALGYPPPVLAGLGDVRTPTAADREITGDVEVAGGRLLIGATRGSPFAYDNEKWAHLVDVTPFRIARIPVTEREFLDFVEDGGYAERSLWSSDAWSWRQEVEAHNPVYWAMHEGSWERRLFDRWVPLDPNRPVVHVSWYEADTYARWAGRRLPDEAEWEAAAATSTGGGQNQFPWGDEPPLSADLGRVDWTGMDTVDVVAHPDADSAWGCRQLLGNVWEWTATTLYAYPNFERDAYLDNSEQFFGSRKVLRGGSWATRSRLLRNTLRNYFTPDRRDVFAGFRTCAL